jgi:methionyl-tRNA synthetase
MELSREDWEMVALVNREVEHYISLLEDAREREAISTVFNISRLGNQLMQHNTPWKLVKARAYRTCSFCCGRCCARSLFVLLFFFSLPAAQVLVTFVLVRRCQSLTDCLYLLDAVLVKREIFICGSLNYDVFQLPCNRRMDVRKNCG